MKRGIFILFLLLMSICLMAQRPHQVVVEVVTSDGTAPTGVSPEVVTFTGNLYRGASHLGVQVTQTTSECYYYAYGGHGVVYIEIDNCSSSWAFGDVLKINVTCNSEVGQASITVGSFGDNRDEVPSAQGGIQLVSVTPVTFENIEAPAVETVNSCTFTLLPATIGTVNISAPSTDFASLPGVNRDDDIAQCFSIEFDPEMSPLVTSFSWVTATDYHSTADRKDLLVSPDGVNWIYSDNTASGVSAVSWSYISGSMKVNFTTTKDNALYAVGIDGTNPAVTTPNAPAGVIAARTGDYVAISCRAVSVPGATYQIYTSPDHVNWTAKETAFSAINDVASKSVHHDMGANTVLYYGIKAYNGNASYQSGLGNVEYTYQLNDFQTSAEGMRTNLIPLPYNEFNNNFNTARLLGIRLGCSAIAKFNAATQKYSYCIAYDGAWIGDFDLEPDGVYFVNLSNSVADQTFNGTLNKSNFNLKTGINLIYVSALDANLDNASDLMSDIGANCTKVQQWNASTQTWSTYPGNNFTLSRLNPVFVYVTADVTYTK